MPCEWIKTPSKAASALTGAVYFHMHGGGHYRGSSRVAAPVCSHVSSLAGIDCLSVNYRVAPEHVWPAAVDDAYAAYCWLTSAEVREMTCGLSPLSAESLAGGVVSADGSHRKI